MLVLPLYSFSSLSVKLLHASHSSFKHTIVLILKVEKTLDREIATENSLLQSSEVEKVAQFFFFSILYTLFIILSGHYIDT